MVEKIKLDDLLCELELTDTARGLAVRTLKKHRKALNMFFQFLLNEYNITMLEQVKAVHIKKFMVFKLDQGCAESYVNSFLRSIRALFNFCVDEEYMTTAENPCLRVKFMKEPITIVTAYSDDDVIKMIDYCNKQVKQCKKRVTKDRGHCSLFIAERNKFMILLLTDTGLRIGELEGLRDSDINRSRVYVNKGKGKKDRVVYCSPEIMLQKMRYDRAKEKYFSRRPQVQLSEYVFVTKLGSKLSNDMAERYVKQIGLKAGCNKSIRMSPHTFRHFFTQKQLDNGANIYDLQMLLGHSSIKTTETYLRSISSDKLLERTQETSPLRSLRKVKRRKQNGTI